MRRICSIFVAFVMAFSYMTVLADATSLFAETKIRILEESTQQRVVVESEEEISDLKLYVAAYNEDVMIDILSKDVDLKVGKNVFDMEPTWTTDECEYVKVYLWDKNLKPYAERVLILKPTIVVENAYTDFSNNTVKVDVSVLNNPGVSSLKMNVAYDSELKLTNVKFNEEFGSYITAPEPYINPQPISLISPLSEIYTDGVLATLTFDISNVSAGRAFADITVTCDNENTFNEDFEEVVFKTVNGKIVFDNNTVLNGVTSDDKVSLMSVDEPMTLTVSNEVSMPGETVKVNVDINNNPGISSLKIDIEYDEVLTLQKIEFNTAFGAFVTAPEPYTNPQSINLISPLSEINVNGTLATLTFLVSEDTQDGHIANITVTYDEDNIFDGDFNTIQMNVENGSVSVYEGLPGDINGDGKVNNQDAILLFRYVAGWNVAVVQKALDTTGDGKINNQDAIQLFRYVAGWNVEIFIGQVCVHDLVAVAEKAPTCTEDGNTLYWHCTKCGKYYKDAKAANTISLANTVVKATGHIEEIIPAVPPTDKSEGNEEGVKCSVCGTILVEPTPIPPLEKKEHNIIYNLTNNDSYLESIKDTIENPNPARFSEYEEVVLKDASVTGYNFEGWYDGTGSNANRVTKIEKNTTEDVKLFARWKVSENSTYTVHFVSDGAAFDITYNGNKVSSVTKPMNEKFVIPDGEMYGYIFLCWTDSRGNIVESIEPGSRGDITLSAHWTSMRNQTRPVKELGAPVILEDDKDSIIYFIYEIGDIVNVPLEVIEDFGNVDALDREARTVKSKTVTAKTATTVAEAVSNVTTKSALITLSDEWNDGLSISKEQASGITQTDIDTISERVENGSQWNISSSHGGSTAYTKNTGSSQSQSHLSTTASIDSENIYDKDYEEHEDSEDVKTGTSSKTSVEKRQDFNIGLEAGYSTKISAKVPVPGAELGGEVGLTSGINVGYSNGRTTYDEDGKYEDKVETKYNRTEDLKITETNTVKSAGTEDYSESHSYTDISEAETANWNSSKGYSKSNNVINEGSISKAISQAINEKFGYYSTSDHKNGKSETQSTLDSSENKREYSSTVEYSIEERDENMTASKVYKNYAGYHRLVEGGTVHVFAVVGYDIATGSYFINTYNILDSKTTPFYDYSNSDPNYKDRENGILPFEIPYAVNKYVASMVARTDGLEIDTETGIITNYEGTADNVLIPNYISVDNGDGTKSAVKVVGISANAFNGKAVKTVMLSEYITEIPDGAFKNCTSLETVIAPSVTSIGKEAFAGCTSLKKFQISAVVTSIGKDAFQDVPEIEVYAAKPDVVKSVAECGAVKISIYLESMVGELSDCEIVTADQTKYFAFYGAGKTFENVCIESKADETIINRATFNSDSDIVLNICSDAVTLSSVTVNAEGIALLLSNDITAVTLDKNSKLYSNTGNTLVTKEVSFTKTYGISSILTVTGKMLICGNVDFTGGNLINATDGKKEITLTDFENIIKTKTVKFEANGGSGVETQTLPYGGKVKKPDDPTKDKYNFIGWYTDKELTNVWNFETPVTEDMTFYAAWELNEFIVTFDANGGTTSVTEKSVIYGNKLGNLPVSQRDYYTFAGWYTEKDGGSEVTAETAYEWMDDITLYAHWTHNEVSGWVLASEVPEGAETVNTKWTYILTHYTESHDSSMAGWEHYNTTSEWSDYGNWSAWQDEWVQEYDWRKVGTQSVISGYEQKTQYFYSRYYGWSSSNQYYVACSYYSGICTTYEDTGWLDYNLPWQATHSFGEAYGKKFNPSTGNYDGKPIYWYNETTRQVDDYNKPIYKTQYRYCDRSLIYTYYYKRNDYLESTTYPSGNNISDIQQWVQYRAK